LSHGRLSPANSKISRPVTIASTSILDRFLTGCTQIGTRIWPYTRPA
jgi:hypothetical protein